MTNFPTPGRSLRVLRSTPLPTAHGETPEGIGLPVLWLMAEIDHVGDPSKEGAEGLEERLDFATEVLVQAHLLPCAVVGHHPVLRPDSADLVASFAAPDLTAAVVIFLRFF